MEKPQSRQEAKLQNAVSALDSTRNAKKRRQYPSRPHQSLLLYHQPFTRSRHLVTAHHLNSCYRGIPPRLAPLPLAMMYIRSRQEDGFSARATLISRLTPLILGLLLITTYPPAQYIHMLFKPLIRQAVAVILIASPLPLQIVLLSSRPRLPICKQAI